jgi:hypothetical protein
MSLETHFNAIGSVLFLIFLIHVYLMAYHPEIIYSDIVELATSKNMVPWTRGIRAFWLFVTYWGIFSLLYYGINGLLLWFTYKSLDSEGERYLWREQIGLWTALIGALKVMDGIYKLAKLRISDFIGRYVSEQLDKFHRSDDEERGELLKEWKVIIRDGSADSEKLKMAKSTVRHILKKYYHDWDEFEPFTRYGSY